MADPVLCIRPEPKVFGPKQLGKLKKALDVQLRDGLVEEIGDVKDLTIDRDGMLPDGYRYTEVGFRQVGLLLGKGLNWLVRDLDGSSRDPERPREEYSFELARKTFNAMLTLRGDRLIGHHRVLRDTKNKMIEGLLGPRYQSIDNISILEQAVDAAATMEPPAAFSHATLTGRLLMVRFIAAKTILEFAPDRGEPDSYRTGLHVANSEIGDQSSFRVAATLVRAADGASSMGPFLGGRRVHTGRDLGRKVSAAFAAVADAAPVPDRLWVRMKHLNDTELTLGGPDEKSRAAAISLISARLRDAGAGRQFATRAVMQAIAGEGMPQLGDDGDRSLYDLYLALIGGASLLYVTSREAAEQVANKLLVGRIGRLS
jgi:hypothetical protein